jgi:hypothetical protein
MKKTLLAIALSIASLAVHAQNTAPADSVRFLIGMGLTAGGDKLATTSYSNGDSSNIKAGSGGQFFAGIDYRISQQVSVQGTLGYHVHMTPEASNGDASFSRVPFEVIAYFHANDKWRVGGGVRLVSNAKLSGDGFAAGLDTSFKNTTGAIVEVEYLMNRNVGFKLRGVSEKYTPSGQNDSLNGNHLGLFANYYF